MKVRKKSNSDVVSFRPKFAPNIPSLKRFYFFLQLYLITLMVFRNCISYLTFSGFGSHNTGNLITAKYSGSKTLSR